MPEIHPLVVAPGAIETKTAASIRLLVRTAVMATRGLPGWATIGRRWTKQGFDSKSFDAEIGHTLTGEIARPLTNLLTQMVLLGRHTASVDAWKLPTTAQAREASSVWAQKYSEVVARDLAASSSDAISALVPNWLNVRMNDRMIGERARDLYGLDPRSALAAESYATRKGKGGSLMNLVNTYLERRATVFGSVHSFTALNYGRQMLFAEAMAQGYLPPDALKVWVTALDERVCPVCRPMDGLAVPVLSQFEVVLPLPKTSRGKDRKSVLLYTPPLHINCRCTLVTGEKFASGIITRTARFRDYGSPRHLADLASEVKDLVFQ